MVGQLYGENDPRRDSGFTIFYMGINLGAFFSPLVAGTLGEMVGWHWGFGCAAVGMILGLIFYQLFRPAYLGQIGLPPHHSPIQASGVEPTPEAIEQAQRDEFEATRPLARVDFQRLAVILVLAFLGNIFFWTAFEQAGSSLNVFAKNHSARPFWLPDSVRDFLADPNAGPAPLLVGLVGCGLMMPLGIRFLSRGMKSHLYGFVAWPLATFGLALVGAAALKPFGYTAALGKMTEFPASWYQSVNPLTIIIFAPVFSALWIALDRWGLNPSTPMKFCWGLWLLGLAFIAMVFAAMRTQGGELAGPHWLLITYFVCTWGELCLSPVGLSMVTKMAPIRLQSLMMGVWFFTMSLSNLFAGLVARISIRVESGEWTFLIPGLPGFFLMLVVFPIGAGMILVVLTPLLKRMMHGIQ
jgi:POT family proton-dependent oligopeptide transporter